MNNRQTTIKELPLDVLSKILSSLPLSALRYLLFMDKHLSKQICDFLATYEIFTENYFQKNLGHFILDAIQNPTEARHIFGLIKEKLGKSLEVNWHDPANSYQAWAMIFHILSAKYWPFQWMRNKEKELFNYLEYGLINDIPAKKCLKMFLKENKYKESDLDLLRQSISMTKPYEGSKCKNLKNQPLYYNLSGLRDVSSFNFIELNKEINFSSEKTCQGLNINVVGCRLFEIGDKEISNGNPLKNIEFRSYSRFLDNLCINNQVWFASLYARRYYLRNGNTEKANLILSLMDSIAAKPEDLCSQTMSDWFNANSDNEKLTHLEKLNLHGGKISQEIIEGAVSQSIFGLFGQPNFLKTDAAQFFIKLHAQAKQFEGPALQEKKRKTKNKPSH